MARISPFSRAYLRKRAAQKMEDACEIWHPTEVSFDRSTGVASLGKGTVLYSGPCRIWQTTPGDHVMIGDEQATVTQTYLSLPYDAYTPRHDDVVRVTKASDPELVGDYFQAIAASVSGGLRASRRFKVAVYKSGRKDSW